MVTHQFTALAFLLTALGPSTATYAQRPPDPGTLIAAQREAMAPLAYMDGVWRGSAWTILPSGVKHTITHTERIGPFLDGSVKVIEGRGYEPDGRVSFNAFGTISYDSATKVFTFHAYGQGRVGDFVMTMKPDGYSWDIPAGPGIIRYTATIKDGAWREVGDQMMPGKEPARFFEMNLKRVGDTTWPAGGAVPMK